MKDDNKNQRVDPQINPEVDPQVDPLTNIEIVGGEASQNQSAVTSETEMLDFNNPKLATLMLQKLSRIGAAIHDTYSEENQETGEGFVEALDEVSEMLNFLWTEAIPVDFLSIPQKAGMIQLLEYLEHKLQRRIRAVDKNDVNF